MDSFRIHGVVGAGAAEASLPLSSHGTIDISSSVDGGRSFQCHFSSLQSFTQCKALVSGTCSSVEMHQLRPPVPLQKCISRDHKERSAWCCQQGKKEEVEKLWRQLFSDPSEWRDHRIDKVNPRFPDFKHRKTQKALWLNSKCMPPWVTPKLAAVEPGTFEMSILSWNRRLSRHCKAGEFEKTIQLFQQMQRDEINPDKFTFLSVLNACARLKFLEQGRRIHRLITENGFGSDLYLSSSLIDMYCKCGSTEDARRVLSKMQTRHVVAWNAMIMGFVKCGESRKALELYQQMQQDGIDPDPATFVAVLNACARVAALKDGRCAHEQIIRRGYELDVFVASSLIDMYTKCGSIEDAQKVFNKTPTRNVVVWTAMIHGCVKCGEGLQALALSQQMQQDGMDPDPVTFVAVLNACASIAALEEGRHAHKEIIRRGYESDVFVGTSLVDMYVKCGSIDDAQRVFSKLTTRSVMAWNAMIQGYVKCGKGQKALELSKEMQLEGVDPDPAVFVAILNACASVGALEEGRRTHDQVTQKGYTSNDFVCNCLVDMYAKCGSIEDAQRVFNKMTSRDVVAWNAIILGYVKCRGGQKALELSWQMQQEGVDPDPVTFVAILNACASIAALDDGRIAHEQIIQRGFESDIFVSNSLVDMYAKCGSMRDAEQVFGKMPSRDVVGWTSMILGYVRCGEGQQALELYQHMQHDGVDPDTVTFVAVLNACASISALEEGRHVHEQIIQRGYESDLFVSNSLVDMYAKCGSIKDAWKVFINMPTRDVVAWNALLGGYSRHGYVQKAIEHFERMQSIVQVDGVTLVSILSACSHGGFLDKGLTYFESMSTVYNISPTVEHYACVVDLLGRAGHMHEAEDLIANMPIEPDATVWMTLLGACRVHGNVEMAERSAKIFLKSHPESSAVYVLLSNIYGAVGKRESSASISQEFNRIVMRLDEKKNWVHPFIVDESKHSQLV